MTRHKTRLFAELTKIRLKKGFKTVEEFYIHMESLSSGGADNETGLGSKKSPHPRWVRINTLKTTLEDQLQTTFAGYDRVDSLEKLLSSKSSEKIIFIDKHIPHLTALPPNSNLSKAQAYRKGQIILQDKASCFPAYLLDPRPGEGDCLDACAAPGNKTTHLAAILRRNSKHASIPERAKGAKIWACERDTNRAEVLKRMVDVSGAQPLVFTMGGQDFLKLDPDKAPWDHVGSILLDPSCSGSGIVGRDDALNVVLPRSTPAYGMAKSNKRKRAEQDTNKSLNHETEVNSLSIDTKASALSDRLSNLSTIQLKMLLHAFHFPKAHKVVYSTCSVFIEENERVVIAALRSPIAKNRNWRILRRNEQVDGMQSWPIRGSRDAFELESENDSDWAYEIVEGCIKCRSGTKDGTQGFFVAGFVRSLEQSSSAMNVLPDEHRHNNPMSGSVGIDPSVSKATLDSEDEWRGFSDNE